MSTTLVLIRHGVTRLNELGVFQGQLDEPLNELGHNQAVGAAPAMAGFQPDALYSSTLRRATQTLDEVASLTGLEVRTDSRLSEIDCGSWQGRSIAEVSEEFPELVELRRNGQDFRRSETGETAGEVADRMYDCLLDIIKANKNQTIVIGSHGLAIRVGIARLLGIPDELSMKFSTMKNCHYAVVSHSKRRVRLSCYNVPTA